MVYEFGTKFSLSFVERIAEVYRLSWDIYKVCKDLKGQIEGYK